MVLVFREGRAPLLGVFSAASYPQPELLLLLVLYYLFFNYLYVLPVWYWITLSNHRHLWISLTAANRLGRPRSGFQPVGALLESLSLRNRAVRGYLWGRNGP